MFEYELVGFTPDILPSPKPLLNFSDILLKTYKGKIKQLKKIRQKYKNIRQNKYKTKKLTKQVIKEMKKSNYLETDDVETVNYNDDININYISTAGDVEIENMSDAETIDYDKVNKDITQQHAKIKRKRKAAMNHRQKKEKMLMLSLLNKYLSTREKG